MDSNWDDNQEQELIDLMVTKSMEIDIYNDNDNNYYIRWVNCFCFNHSNTGSSSQTENFFWVREDERCEMSLFLCNNHQSKNLSSSSSK